MSSNRQPKSDESRIAVFLEDPIGPRYIQAIQRPPSLTGGDVIGDFIIERTLGEGGLAIVYLAKQRSLDRNVALKVSVRTSAEARTLAQLEHDHIVRVFSEVYEEKRNLRLLCMQYVPGRSLDKLEPGEIALLCKKEYVDAVLDIGCALADALAFAHEKGVLHLDVKPANILLHANGKALLADFNVSLHEKAFEEGSFSFGGTQRYMAPEQTAVAEAADKLAAIRNIDGRSDVFGLGLVLTEMLKDAEGVPPELSEVLRKAMAETKESRYTALELKAQLMGCRVLRKARQTLKLRDRLATWFPLAMGASWFLPHAVGAAILRSPQSALVGLGLSCLWSALWRRPQRSHFNYLELGNLAFGLALWVPFQSVWIGLLSTAGAMVATSLLAMGRAYPCLWVEPGGIQETAARELSQMSRRLFPFYFALVVAPLSVPFIPLNDSYLNFAKDIYRHGFKRAPTAGEATTLARNLQAGKPRDVVLQLLRTEDARQTLVADWLISLLGVPDSYQKWKAHEWVKGLAEHLQTQGPQRVLGWVLDSAYFRSISGNSDAGFWQGFNRIVLGRASDPKEVEGLIAAEKKSTRKEVVDWMLHSEEARRIWVGRWIKDIRLTSEPLFFVAHSPEADWWASVLKGGHFQTYAEFLVDNFEKSLSRNVFYPRIIATILAFLLALFSYHYLSRVRRAFYPA